MMWNLQSYPTSVLNERMWHFWGWGWGSKHILTPPSHFLEVMTPPLRIYTPVQLWDEHLFAELAVVSDTFFESVMKLPGANCTNDELNSGTNGRDDRHHHARDNLHRSQLQCQLHHHNHHHHHHQQLIPFTPLSRRGLNPIKPVYMTQIGRMAGSV